LPLQKLKKESKETKNPEYPKERQEMTRMTFMLIMMLFSSIFISGYVTQRAETEPRANYAVKLTIKAVPEGGDTTPSAGDYYYEYDPSQPPTVAVVTANIDPNYKFGGWFLNGIPINQNPIHILMTQDYTLILLVQYVLPDGSKGGAGGKMPWVI